MQAEKQNQPVTAPQNAALAESDESKSKRGGRRPGAGRKPNLVKRMVARLTPATAREVLATVDIEKVIGDIFKKGSLTLKQRTLADLWDRAYGRPAQNVALSGGLVHAHTTWRPLSNLSDEEMRLLDSISKRLLPANTSQDGPQNQPEKPEIKAEESHETAHP